MIFCYAFTPPPPPLPPIPSFTPSLPLCPQQRHTKVTEIWAQITAWPNTPPPPPPSGKTKWESERMREGKGTEEAGWASCRWSPDVVALGTGHSGAVKGDSELPSFPFSLPSLHLLAQWQEPSGLAERVETQQRVPPSQVWPLRATQQSARVNKMHTCTIPPAPPASRPPKAVTRLLTHGSRGPAVFHYDKYTRVAGSCQPGLSHQILWGVHLQPFKAHFAKELQPFSSS